MNDSKKYMLVGLVAAGIFAVLVFFLMGGPGAPGPNQDAGAGSGPGSQPDSGSYFTQPTGSFKSGAALTPAKNLAHYKAYAIYPPTSRPLKRHMVGLMTPNRRYESFLPVGGPPPGAKENRFSKPADVPNPGLFYIVTADKYAVIGEDSITFILMASTRKALDAEKSPVKILSAELRKGQSHISAKRVMDIRFNDEGMDGDRKAGDYTYSVQITPSKTAALSDYHGRVQVYVKFEVNGIQTESLVPFEFFPQKTIPATFTGNFEERVEDGSLVIYAELNVKRAGYYIVDANLFDSLEVPVAYTRFKGDLEGGRQKVRLLFFGKVIRDVAPESPFKLRNLRGYRLLEGKSPDREIIPWYTKEFTSKTYRILDDFSDKEWTSPHKKKKIKFLEEEAKQGNTGPANAN